MTLFDVLRILAGVGTFVGSVVGAAGVAYIRKHQVRHKRQTDEIADSVNNRHAAGGTPRLYDLALGNRDRILAVSRKVDQQRVTVHELRSEIATIDDRVTELEGGEI